MDSITIGGIDIKQWLDYGFTAVYIYLAMLIIYSILQVANKHKKFKELKEVYSYPVPKINNPFLGHMNEFSQRVNEFKWHRELGKLFGFYYGHNPMLKVADLSLINEIFLKQTKLFEARILSDYRITVIEQSILFNTGQAWKRSRRVIQPAMAQYRVKKDDHTTMKDIHNGIDRLVKHFKMITRQSGDAEAIYEDDDFKQYHTKGYMSIKLPASPTGWAVDFSAYDLMQAVTIDVIFRLAFNMDTIDVLAGKSEPNLENVRFVMKSTDKTVFKIGYTYPGIRFFLTPFILPLMKAYKKFHKRIRDHNANLSINSSTQQSLDQPKRVYNILWDEYKAGNMTQKEVRANILATCVAGFETTAATSSYVLWCIAKHNECREKLRFEVMNYGIESEYLDMFIKEVMRMYPALPNFVIRTPDQDTTVNGYVIKRGMSVYLSINSIHYDESIWPNPHKFDPERFAKGKTYPPGAYAPFGLGHRMCAGYQLALREMKTIVCELMTNFDIQLIAPLEMTLDSSTIFLTQPSNEIRLRLVPLSASSIDPSQSTRTPSAPMTIPPEVIDSEKETTIQTASSSGSGSGSNSSDRIGNSSEQLSETAYRR